MGSVVGVGRRSKVGGIIVPVSLLYLSAFCPNFLVLKAEKFALFSLQKGAQPLYISAFKLDLLAILDNPTLCWRTTN
ncbi:MAG: hypothetical protein QNJ74_05750 [Trichodesmium sp. MO_231.B1]|nr:hypothetical protein [Trichodesmium sp. MO_231.B1]